ncbi:nucleotidyl-sugar pyranose mutase [Vibrio sp. JPW-9-11-11]|uniref:protoporphyrinogen/coproporphyrinogen oxidase n=1 Tax=Vibrio sp. JPW-9-11-11 TaxID=1416532 RepID=UPI0015932B03|nr:NAD(P)-binding protein [Vibrio sp. JPW-9-11-11]NVD05384.1 nucleotidyl-sugar pyranose mutase [Vibrio sp. JPW-9-11-11]
MLNIAVVGAGISGLSVAKMLQKEGANVHVFEKSSTIGGIARVTDIEGYGPYHTVGGHCFNSKYDAVKKFVFEEVLPKDKWNKINRNAKISFQSSLIPYPIELNLHALAKVDQDLASDALVDFMTAPGGSLNDNLASWFKDSFGTTLSDRYFIPYNRKIWGREPSQMSSTWVSDKLPLPNKKQVAQSLFTPQQDFMPHASFYYPKSGSQNEFIEALSQGLKITKSFEVKSINNGIINDELKFDFVISTIPLNEICNVVSLSREENELCKALKYNKVTTMLWETNEIEETWLYYPEEKFKFHRLINIGSFIRPKRNIAITEAVGEVDYDEMVNSGKEIHQLIKPISYNVSSHAYVVFEEETRQKSEQLIKTLETHGVYSHGRFGHWEYYNMDICIQKSFELVERLKRIYKNEF